MNSYVYSAKHEDLQFLDSRCFRQKVGLKFFDKQDSEAQILLPSWVFGVRNFSSLLCNIII
jgi:hypothetical protein